jgi:hypothetical protein
MKLLKGKGGGWLDMWNKILQIILKELARRLSGVMMKVFQWLLKVIWAWLKRIFRRK